MLSGTAAANWDEVGRHGDPDRSPDKMAVADRTLAMPLQGKRGGSRVEVSVLPAAQTTRGVSWTDPSREDVEEKKTKKRWELIRNNILNLDHYYARARTTKWDSSGWLVLTLYRWSWVDSGGYEIPSTILGNPEIDRTEPLLTRRPPADWVIKYMSEDVFIEPGRVPSPKQTRSRQNEKQRKCKGPTHLLLLLKVQKNENWRSGGKCRLSSKWVFVK